MLFGLIYALYYSLGMVGLLRTGFSFEHWSSMLESSELWYSLALSIYIAALTVLLTLIVSLRLALVYRTAIQSGRLVYSFYLPLTLPATVAAFLVYQFFSDSGVLSRLLLYFDVIDARSGFPSMVNDPAGIGIILAHLLIATPFFTLLFAQTHTRENIHQLTLLTFSLGGTPQQALFRVTLPILLKRSLGNILLLFITVFGSYEIPLLLGRQAPQMISVMTLRKYEMYDLAQKPEAFIAALLYSVIIFSLLLFAHRKGWFQHEA